MPLELLFFLRTTLKPNALPKLKWCQSTCAGVDPLFQIKSNDLKTKSDDLPFHPPWMLTRFAGNFGPPTAEWCFGRIIEHERHFTTTTHDQRNKQWEG